MTKGIEKYRMEERIRRSFFRHRGNLNKIIEDTGLEPRFVRSICRKIKKGFSHDINFQTACFITDAILSGREQRLVILEDRLDEILNKKELISACCNYPIKKDSYERSIWYKCKKCGVNCEIVEVDNTRDIDVARLIDCMRKEDELIGEFLAAMGLVAKGEEEEPEPAPRRKVSSSEVRPAQESLPPVEKKLIEKINQLDESKISEIRRFIETKVNEALNGSERSE